jgi:hypothetical protein
MRASPALVSEEGEKNRRPGGSSVVGFPCRSTCVYADGCSLGRTAKFVVLRIIISDAGEQGEATAWVPWLVGWVVGRPVAQGNFAATAIVA